jgi:hypothetical protein
VYFFVAVLETDAKQCFYHNFLVKLVGGGCLDENHEGKRGTPEMACTFNISSEINYFKRMHSLHTEQDVVYGRLFYVVSRAVSVETRSSRLLREAVSPCSNPCHLKDGDTTLLTVLM